MKTFAVIPARGGSKGLPRKNILPIAGKPLIAWTIEAALACKRIDRVIVSTDDFEIATIAKQVGAEVPFMRPADLASDDAPGIAPLLHAIDMLPRYHTVLLLQPTSPLRDTCDIEAVLDLSNGQNVFSAVSVCEVEDHPFWTYAIDNGGRLQRADGLPEASRRQDLPPRFVLNGAIYCANIEWLRKGHRLVDTETLAYVMPAERSVDIDSPFDWRFAEMMLKDRLAT